MSIPPDSLITPFENGNGNQTCTYEECIAWYAKLDAAFREVQLQAHGNTSVGKPIHLLVVDKDKQFTPEATERSAKAVLFVNNGIHPGEPDGIDASMMFVRDLLTKKEYTGLLDHVVLLIVPVYNVAGMLDRGAYSRVNQNGPEEYGFRGNRQHLDLNRDFVKCDSKEAETFNRMFAAWRPQLLVDTHVSNGADYQYTMTYIPTQPDKLPPVLCQYETQRLIPELEKRMTENGWEMTPYVNPMKEIPDDGIVGFLETPRYSTGYAALHHCIGFMPETHMLKPYADRLRSTYQFLLNTLEIAAQDWQTLVKNQRLAQNENAKQKEISVRWQLDENKKDTIRFKGYAAAYKPSAVTGKQRLYYHRSKPFEKDIPFYNSYKPTITVIKPAAYVIPSCYDKVIQLLEINGVELEYLEADRAMEVQVYKLKPRNQNNRLFESRHPHAGVDVEMQTIRMPFYKGDAVARTGQNSDRYIVETLEPQAHDSFFTWNYFDGVLSQKESYSDYVWEDKAAELLEQDPNLKSKFEAEKKANPDFANDAAMQLDFVYRHSPYFEPSFALYPIARLLK